MSVRELLLEKVLPYASDFKTLNKRKKIIIWVSIILLVGLMGSFIWMITNIINYKNIIAPIVFIPLIAIIWLCIIIWYRNMSSKVSSNLKNILNNDLILDLYFKYWNEYVNEVPNVTKEAKGVLKLTRVALTTSANFKGRNSKTSELIIEDEMYKYIYDINTWEEIRYVTVTGSGGKKQQVPKTYYFTNWDFTIGEKNNKDFGFICTLKSKGRLTRKGNFQSESIEFNNSFAVNGDDILAIAKKFKPSTIVAFNEKGNRPYANKIISIYKNSYNVSCTTESECDSHFGIGDLRIISYKSIESFVDSVIAKLNFDFEGLIKYVWLLDPLL